MGKTGTVVAQYEPADEVATKMEAVVLSNFLNPKYSDLTITCDEEVFPAHRNIVCPQSTYFEVACDGRFKEADGKIRLDDQDPMLVKKTLEFLYTGNYTYEDPLDDSLSKAEIELFSENKAETSMANPRTGEAYFHAQMYAQGDYFQIDALKGKAKQRFEESFMTDPFDGESFTSAVVEVYSSTAESDRGLRDLLVQLTIDRLYILRAQRNLILDGNLLERVPSFMRDICISALDRCDEFQREAAMRRCWDGGECSEGASQSTRMYVQDRMENW